MQSGEWDGKKKIEWWLFFIELRIIIGFVPAMTMPSTQSTGASFIQFFVSRDTRTNSENGIFVEAQNKKKKKKNRMMQIVYFI